MIEIENTIVSLDLLSANFTCNLALCKGACCVSGDSGAPLEKHEAEKLQEIYPYLQVYLRKESIITIERTGTSVVDIENDTVTPLVEGRECAYAYFENGIARCSIERAYLDGAIQFRKPISCYLYPVRIKKYRNFDAVNYDQWEICKPAIELGNSLGTPVYRFVKDALHEKYGEKWFNLLEMAARNLQIEKEAE
jgi:hypothetical protein